MNDDACLRALPAERLFMTRYRSRPLPEHLESFGYRVVTRRLAADREASVLGRLALRLSRANGGIPVVRLQGRTLVSFEPLSDLTSDDPKLTVEPVDAGPLLHHTVPGRRALLRLIRGYLKRRAAERGFVVGLSDFVLSPRFRLTDEANRLGLQTGVVFDMELSAAGVVVLDCDMKSKILEQESVAARLLREPDWDPRGLQVSSLLVSESFVVDEVLERTVGEVDESLGMSVVDYNRSQGRYPEGLEPDPTRPVVACRVGTAGRRYHYDSQLLHVTLDLAGARRVDRDFGARLADATRLDTSERERFCSYFVRQVAEPGPSWLSFSPQPDIVGPGTGSQGWDVALPADNLVFGGGALVRSVEKGVVECGLLGTPSAVRLGVLVPAGREKAAQGLVDGLLTGLDELVRAPATFSAPFVGTYQPRNPFKMKASVDELVASGADLALVLLPGKGEGSPYVTLKAELARRRFPSQMLHLDTSLSRRELVNVLVGLTAKLGKSENWRLGRLLWPPDLFVGIGAGSLEGGRMAAVATAFDAAGHALDVTVEIFEQEGEAIGESRLLHLLEGALLAYRSVKGNLPGAVVVHRDGTFLEAGCQRVWKHFRDLGVTMTLVEVDVGLPPRIGKLRGDAREAPAPGTLVLTGEDEGWVITSAPGGGRGCPLPVGFRRVAGLVDLRALGSHVFWLTRAHAGSVMPPRLPVTVHFARRVVELAGEGLVPQGTMGSRMLFV